MYFMVNYAERFQAIANKYHKTKDYRQMYKEYTEVSNEVWADTERKDYPADLWYNLNCNEICLSLLGSVCDGKKVLSIGGGFWAEKALLKSITWDEQFLKGAKEIILTDIVADVGVKEEDATALSFPDNSFDVVICRELIEHVIDADLAFSEIRRVLKPKGYLLITTPNCYSVAVDGVFHLRGFTPTSFLAELIDQSFTIERKMGNVPYCFHGLKIYTQVGIEEVLEDFKKIDAITRDDEFRYYLGTNLFVLARLK